MAHFCRSLLIVVLILTAVPAGLACDAIVVGRLASADGSVLLGHNEENALDRVIEFRKIPRLRQAADAKVDLGRGGQLDPVPETWAFLWSENPGLEYSDGYLNEWGVAVASIQCLTREDSYDTLVARGEIRDGGIGYMLRRLVAQRARSAREGLELIGQLVERFGYADSGRTYALADSQEAWVVEVVRGRRWVAQRVPDDAVVILPARHVIGEIDLADRANFRASPDLVSYATQRGWFDPAGGQRFNFRLAYQAPERTKPEGRQFRGQEVVSGKPARWPPEQPLDFAVRPRQRLSVADVAAVLRDPGGVAAFFNQTTQEAAVFQLRPGWPREIGCVYWRTTGRPDISVLTPWHVAVTATPESYGRRGELPGLLSLEQHFRPPPETYQPDFSRAWWKFKRLAQVVDQSYAQRIGIIQESWSAMEQRLVQEQTRVEAEALALWPTDPDAARALLTRFCSERALTACAEADRLTKVLVSRRDQCHRDRAPGTLHGRCSGVGSCYPSDLAGDPRLQTLVNVVRSVDYRRQLAELPGYAVTDTDEIQQVD
jgi:dipeptidase